MLKRLDESKFLSNLLENVSNFVAKYRGLPILAGIALVFLGTVLLGANVFVESKAIEFVGIIIQGGGILTALIGIALATAIGE